MIPNTTISQPAGSSKPSVHVPSVMAHLDHISLSCCYHPETRGIFPYQSHGITKDFLKSPCPGPIPTSPTPYSHTCTGDAPGSLSEKGQGCAGTDVGQWWHMSQPKAASEQGEHAPGHCPHGPAQPGTRQGHQVTHVNATSANTTVGVQRLCAALCLAKAQSCPLPGALKEFIHSKSSSCLSRQPCRTQRAVC